MSKTREEIIQELDSKIPRDVVRQREGGGGRSFSYLEGHYVIARLNEALGQGNWSYIVTDLRNVHNGENPKGGFVSHYVAVVQIQAPILGSGCVFSDVGYGDGADKYLAGKCHELAAKEAVTDALKRAAKNLGMSMGLALYDKDQTNVEDDSPRPRAVAKSTAPDTDKPKTVKAPPVASAVPSEPKPQKSREEINGLINSTLRVLTAKRGPTGKEGVTQELGAHLKEKYGVAKSAELKDPQAAEFLQHLETLIK